MRWSNKDFSQKQNKNLKILLTNFKIDNHTVFIFLQFKPKLKYFIKLQSFFILKFII